MLVPLVLRSIVFPYLRGVTASPQIPSTARLLSTSRRRLRAAEALLVCDTVDERFPHAWAAVSTSGAASLRAARLSPEPPRVRRGVLDGDLRDSPSRPASLPRTSSGVHQHKRPAKSDETISSTPESATTISRPTKSSTKHATTPSSKHSDSQQQPKPKPRSRSMFDLDNRPQIEIPVAVTDLLRGRLYRMAVFHILSTPELAADVKLVETVCQYLEKRGAGKLARRLRRSIELSNATPDPKTGKIRLWSDPKDANTPRKPDDYWRPAHHAPRRAADLPEPTAQERRTHHYNLQISRHLTKVHATPYAFAHSLPRIDATAGAHHDVSAPQPKLRRLRDVLAYVHKLRTRHDFVPDRITANIVIGAYLNALARGTDGDGVHARSRPGRAGLDRRELRELFALVAESMESSVRDGLGRQAADIYAPAPVSPPSSSSGGVSETQAPPPETCEPQASLLDDSDLAFDNRVDYKRHVQAFGNMMCRAMARVGDHAARVRVEEWMERMRIRLEGVGEGRGSSEGHGESEKDTQTAKTQKR